MPGMSGLALQKELQGTPALEVVFMSAHATAPISIEAFRAGASDFLLKPFAHQELLRAVRAALAVSGERVARAEQNLATRTAVGRLTPREREVMTFVVKGCTNREIAEMLGIALVTVKLHRGRVMNKMQADSLAELVALTRDAGIV